MRSGVGAFCVGSRREWGFLLLDFFFLDVAGEEWLADFEADAEADEFAATTELACCGCM
jgi:hypothetical protein